MHLPQVPLLPVPQHLRFPGASQSARIHPVSLVQSTACEGLVPGLGAVPLSLLGPLGLSETDCLVLSVGPAWPSTWGSMGRWGPMHKRLQCSPGMGGSPGAEPRGGCSLGRRGTGSQVSLPAAAMSGHAAQSHPGPGCLCPLAHQAAKGLPERVAWRGGQGSGCVLQEAHRGSKRRHEHH